MQHSSHTKTWANDDAVINPVANDSPAKDQPVEADEVPQELTYAQRKKAKLGETSGEDIHVSRHDEPEPMVVDASGEDNTTTEQAMDQEQPAVQEEEQQPVSDTDWLRSKTSRLLGLLDEEEQAEFNSAAQRPTDSTEPAADAEVDTENAEADHSPAAADAAEPAKTPEVDTNIENIRISARLFVRNLSYDTKESDLEPVFAPFGRIEEVSTSILILRAPAFSFFPISCKVARMMIILIGTSDAKHMM